MSMSRKSNRGFGGAAVDLNPAGLSQSDKGKNALLFTAALFAMDNRSCKTTSEKPKNNEAGTTFGLDEFKATNFGVVQLQNSSIWWLRSSRPETIIGGVGSPVNHGLK